MFIGSYTSFFRKENMEKKGHRWPRCGRCPTALQEKALHADSILGKLQGLVLWVLCLQGPSPGVCPLQADHLPHQIALP